MNLYDQIVNQEEKISLVGLGYVGLPIAISFAKKVRVLGFDINQAKVEEYRQGIDPTKEVGDEAVKNTTMEFTADAARLQEAKFHIVAVPTPITEDRVPDLSALKAATTTVGKYLTKGSYVVFESTVYPGVTEEICIPLLEKKSGLKVNEDFKVGFSPERINPGDKVNRLETIVKVVSGSDEEALDLIAKVYEIVVDAGVHKASSIIVAEAAKVIENAQRDINIAFMNELSMIFNRLEIDTREVLEAAGTKWNFLPFTPGLVGGHCIGVDPYYLTYKAEQTGYHPQVILAGRRINDNMGHYVVENIIKNMIAANISIKGAKVGIIGFTFKENTPDTRNTRVIDIYKELQEYKIDAVITDDVADAEEAYEEYGLEFISMDEMRDLDVVIVAVAHDANKELTTADFNKLYNNKPNQQKVFIDVKSLYDRTDFAAEDYIYWSL